MSDCARIRELLVIHAEGELEPRQAHEVTEHLSTCAMCLRESEEIAELRGWLADPEMFAPSESEAWKTLASSCASRVAGGRKRARAIVPMRWALPIAAAVLFAAGLVWMTRHPQTLPVTAAAPGNDAFLGRMQSEVTSDSLSRYLSQCRDLLVDVLKTGQTCKGNRFDVAFEVTRARDLLQRKRMLDPELNEPEVAPAKDLCDDLENFLVDLSLAQDCESADKFRAMEHFIENEQLLLRIQVVESEMSSD